MLTGVKSLLQNPKWRTWFFITFTLLFYYTRTRPPEPIYDIELVGNHIYLAVGKTGVKVLDIRDRGSPKEIASLDTYGIAYSLDVIGQSVYVADGSDGLKLLSTNKDGIELVGSYRTPGKALDVAIKDSSAFVIDSEVDLLILRINEKNGQFSPTSTHDVPDKAEKIKIVGDRAYISNNKNRFMVFDISAPNNPSQLSFIDLPAKINNFTVIGNYAYIAADEMGLVILDVVSGFEVIIAGQYDRLGNANDVDVRGKFAYVAGREEGYFVLDISDIGNISEIGRESSPSDTKLVRNLDDYVYISDDLIGLKSFQSPILYEYTEQIESNAQGIFDDVVTRGNFAYIAAGDTGLRVIDVQDPGAPKSIPYIDDTYDYATAVDIQGDYIYVTYQQEGLHQYNIGVDPRFPTSEGVEASFPGEPQDVSVEGRWVFVASGSAGLQIIDLSDIASPEVFSIDTPGTAKGVFIHGEYAYLADGEKGLQIIAVNDPRNPYIIQNINTFGDATSVYVTKIQISADEERTYAFIANGFSGLYIADITDINQPVNVATVATQGAANDIIVRDQIAYLLTGNDGVVLLDISSIRNPIQLGNQATPGEAKRFDLDEENTAYVADHSRGLRIIQISDPTQPREISFIDAPVTARVILTTGNQGYMVDGKGGLWLLDLTDPQIPKLLSLFTTPGEALNLTFDGAYAYIADGSAGLQVVNITNVFSPQLEGGYKGIENVVGVAIRGGYAYVVTGDRKHLHVLDIADFANIQEVGSFQTAGNAENITIYGSLAFITEGLNGIEVVNIQDPTDPSITSIGKEFNLQDARSILFRENVAFIADGTAGMKVYNMASPANPEPTYSFSVDGGIATSLTIEGEYVFLTVDQTGIYPFDVVNSSNIMYAGLNNPGDETKEIPKDEDFRAFSIAVVPAPTQGSRRYINYTTSDVLGLQLFQASGNPYINQKGLYETPGEASLVQVVRSLPNIAIGVATGQPEIVEAKVWARLWYMFFGTCVFIGLFGLYLVLFSQFVLPVQTLREGFKAITRLYTSLKGEHGPVVYVKEGNTIARPDELERRGPGVARVDLNSAIVFEKRALLQPKYRQKFLKLIGRAGKNGQKVPRARVEGPGVQFIEPYENIHGVADLRPQFRLRPGVQAYTRDGIEFSNPVWILFTLGQAPAVLDVTYEGDRIADNLRVIHFSEADIPKRDSIQSVSDEDARNYELYQATRRFFQKINELATQLLENKNQAGQILKISMHEFITQVEEIAIKWDVRDIPQIQQILSHLENLGTNIDEPTDDVIISYLEEVLLISDQLLGEVMTDFFESVFQGRKQRGFIVKQLSDELDPDDKDEIHRYVQTQTEFRFFANLQNFALSGDLSLMEKDEIKYFVGKVYQLAVHWGIHKRECVQEYIDCISALALEINTSVPSGVEWFFYNARMLSETIVDERMVQFYSIINREMIIRYQDGLRGILESPGLSRLSRKSIQEMCDEFPVKDELRLFNLNALALQKIVKPEYETRIKKIKDDPVNDADVEILSNSLIIFNYLTSNLVRTEFPNSDDYRNVSIHVSCFSDLNQISQKINLRSGWKFPSFIKIIKIRRIVKNSKRIIQSLEQNSNSEFKRYADLIQINDFVQQVGKCISNLHQSNGGNDKNNPGLKLCVQSIKQNSQLLDNINQPAYQRQVEIIKKRLDALNYDNPVYVYYFAKQLDDVWQKISQADNLVVKHYLQKSNQEIQKLRDNIRAFNDLSSRQNSDGEVRHYQDILNDILSILKDYDISENKEDKSTGGGQQIQFGPFQFVRRRVLAAVYSKALDIDLDGNYIPWTDLPVHAAAQTYRDMVSKEQYDYLYEPKDPRKYNMPKLKGNFSRAMRNQGILAYRFIDNINGKRILTGSEWVKDELIYYDQRELKNPKVLRVRGIKVIASGFPDLVPVNPRVPEQWLENWRAPWTSKATDVRGEYQLKAARVINQARAQAQRDMAHTLARILRSSQSDEALALRVFQALESTTIDSDTRQFLPRDTMYLLQSFKQWFLPDRIVGKHESENRSE